MGRSPQPRCPLPFVLALLLWSCDAETTPVEADDDLDDDGYSVVLGDCDDTDSSVHPLADEWCDGVDNDCDRVVDESSALDAQVFWQDLDGDGYGDATVTVTACSVPEGHVQDATDCDDDDADIHPAAEEIPCNAILESCTGQDGDRIVPDQYAVLQDAISDATPGETICVYEGTYDAVTIDRALTLIGMQGAGRTEIDGDDGPAVHVEAVSGVTLIGLSFTDGDAEAGGGLLVEYSSDIVVEDCIFTENEAEQGGAMAVRSSEDVTIRGAIFVRNQAVSGGGISVWNSQDVALEGCEFESNGADEGGGAVDVANSLRVDLSDLRLDDGAAAQGGGLKAVMSGVSLDTVTITGNVADHGGGLYLEQSALTATAAQVNDNQAVGTSKLPAAGGGLYAIGGSVELSGLSFSGNSPDDTSCNSTSGC